MASLTQTKKQVITPPLDSWANYIGGYGCDMKLEIQDLITTINKLEIWEWLETDNPPQDKGYIWWEHENINKISNGLVINNHSGMSFAMCLREIQYIAKNSWIKWNTQNREKNEKRALLKKKNLLESQQKKKLLDNSELPN